MKVPKSFYSCVLADKITQRILYVNCDLCKDRVFDFSVNPPEQWDGKYPTPLDVALKKHFSGKHRHFIRLLSRTVAGLDNWIKD